MDARGTEVVRTVIEIEEADPGVMLEFERLGDEAFDAICAELQSDRLTPQQQVNALRSLGRLTRQQCFDRKEAALEEALRLTESTSQIARSGGVNAAIWATLSLERFPERASRPENRPGAKPSLRQRVQQVVRRAVERGLDAEQDKFARRFLNDLPPEE